MRFSTYWRGVQAILARASAGIGSLLGRRAGPVRRRGIVAAAVGMAAGLGLLVASAIGVLGAPTKFESGDGNMTLEATGNIDWNCLSTLEGIKITKNGSKCGTFDAKAYVSMADPNAYTAQDISWKPGQKQDTSCPVLTEGKSPGKDTFTNIASYNETSLVENKLGHTFLFGATIRFTANGNASENVELNQEAGTSSCSIPRTAGDKLIAINYLNGGTKVEFSVLTWITETTGTGSTPGENEGTCLVGNDTPPCWGAKVKTLSESAAEGKTNQSEIIAEENGLNKKALVAGKFAEFGIDLTAAGIIPEGSCKSFPQTVWESRSSGSSFVSNPEDIEIEKHEISNCGTIKIVKQTNPRGVDKVFGFESTLPADSKAGGVACTEGGSSGIDEKGHFCLNDAGNKGTENSKGNTVESEVPAGEYTVTEEAVPSGFEFSKATCKGGTTEVVKEKVVVKLSAGDEVTCVFVNNKLLGALKITKVSSKEAHTPLEGAVFKVKDPEGGEKSYTTDENGVVCLDKLSLLGEYAVTETKAPAGYSINEKEAKKITVTGTNAKCADEEFGGQSLTFEDTPLTEILVEAKSEATGGTKSTIKCSDSVPKAIGNSPQEGEAPKVTAKKLAPGTYTCEVVVDP